MFLKLEASISLEAFFYLYLPDKCITPWYWVLSYRKMHFKTTVDLVVFFVLKL